MAAWPSIYKACTKYQQFLLHVEEYTEEALISDQQRKFWHAKPVSIYADYTGHSILMAEILLKKECGENYFILEPTEKNMQKRGRLMFECANCKQLFFLPKRNPDGVLCCDTKNCHSTFIRPVFVLSKMEISVKHFNEILKNAYDFLNGLGCNCPMPDPNWRDKNNG